MKVWIGLFSSIEDAQKIRSTNPHEIHMTMLYLGKISQDQYALIRNGLHGIASSTNAIHVTKVDYGIFNGENSNVLYVSIQRGMKRLQSLRKTLEASCDVFDTTFNFTPHFTVEFVKDEPKSLYRKRQKITLKQLHLVVDGNHEVFYLTNASAIS